MKVPWSWLTEFVPVKGEPEDVADRLSLRGLTVDEILRVGTEVSGVVVGSVLKVDPHPNADSLVLVRVDTGGDVREIVCGARNFGPGDRVPVALPGARLPGGVEIGERSVRGRVSHGMLCSARELHISDDHSGILLLDGDAVPGGDVRALLGLDEVVLDVDVTPNRPDALSIVGIAREVAALEGLPLVVPEPVVAEGDTPAAELVEVVVSDGRGCPRYLARVVTGLRNLQSPAWMRRRLLACGMRPINAVVDITNYVLLERGHPLHAFDLEQLTGHRIVVRRARSGERITTLDGIDRRLERDDVAICDAIRPVAVAGVMGGGDGEVTSETTDVVLESAYFDPARVGRTARRLGLRTEASVRFERGADPEAPPAAASAACRLLAEICGGTIAAGAVDVARQRKKTKPIRLGVGRTNRLLGVSLAEDDMAALLRTVEMDVTRSGRDALRVTAPSFRPDIGIEEDLVEEVARLHGFDRIPETLPSSGRAGGLTEDQEARALVRRLLLGSGLSEAFTLSLLPGDLADRLTLSSEHPWRQVVRVANPLSEAESALRPAVLPGLLLAAERNLARRVSTVAMFEIGVAFLPGGEAPVEDLRAAWVLAGRDPAGWHGEREFDVFDSAGVIDALASGLRCEGIARRPATDAADVGHLHPGRAALVEVGGEVTGWVGEIHPRVARALDLSGRVAVGEISLGPLLRSAFSARAAEVPRFPAVERDLAVVVPTSVTAADVRAVVTSAGRPRLSFVEIFDVYRGEQAGEGNVSLAFRLAFRDSKRTLTDVEAGEAMAAILGALAARGWRPRA